MDSFLLVARVVLSLGAVLVLIYWLQKRLAAGAGSGRTKAVTIIARQGISQKASVVVIDTGGRRLTLGVTEQNITVLTDVTAPEPEPAAEPDEETSASAGKWNDTVAGSILAPDTWRQAMKALKRAPRP